MNFKTVESIWPNTHTHTHILKTQWTKSSETEQIITQLSERKKKKNEKNNRNKQEIKRKREKEFLRFENKNPVNFVELEFQKQNVS